MKILVFNQDWFAKEWREMGHEVVTYGCRHDLEVQQSTFVIQVQHVLESLPADFSPDVLVFHDNSMPVTVLGLEQVEIPTVFLSVDVHHHHEVHKYLSFIFDIHEVQALIICSVQVIPSEKKSRLPPSNFKTTSEK